MNQGRFIVIEGIEGSGKTSAMQTAADVLRRAHKDIHLTREPGGTQFAEEIRKLVLHWHEEEIPPMTELLMMFAARAHHLQKVIIPRLEQGEWVLCDRFTDSSYAYQGAGRGLKEDTIAQMEQLVQGTMQPDLVLLMDLPVLEGQQRNAQQALPGLDLNVQKTLPGLDRIESEHEAFHQRVRECYLRRARLDPDRYIVVNASKSREQMLCDVEAALSAAVMNFTKP